MNTTSRIEQSKHLTVCICTYKRTQLLLRLLHMLIRQFSGGLFTFSICVVDNDATGSAEPVVSSVKSSCDIRIDYFVEPQQSIALSRNRAVTNSRGDYVAFIDDDELPCDKWLYELYTTCREYHADAVFGPILPLFEQPPPVWVRKGKIFERRSFSSGTRIREFRDTRTGNVLIAKKVFENIGLFDPKFGRTGGEDVDFFKRLIDAGYRLYWSEEAPVEETVPPARWELNNLLRRALVRGNITVTLQPAAARFSICLKSFTAVGVYSLMLPFLLIRGKGYCIRYLIKLCDHAGKILSILHIKMFQKREA